MFSPNKTLELTNTYRDGLLENVLPFWLDNGVDAEFGGLISSLDCDGSIVDTDKAVWIQGRFAWLLGELFNHPACRDHPDRDRWLEVAQSTLDFVREHAFDPADGRMWFQLTRDGQPIRKRRYAFSESFAAIAFGELAQSTKRNEYAVHDWSYQHFADPDHGEWYGYLHRDGSLSSPLKGNLWKGPFHLPRMQLICWNLLANEI